jgi:hypothetical protein
LLWAGPRAAHGKITLSGISNGLTECVIFIVLKNDLQMWPARRIILPEGPWVGDT